MTTLLNGHEIVNGHRIATGVHGDGEPLVLVHGTPSHSYIWRNVVPDLVEAGYRVYLFDLLGYGASERPLAADTSVAGQEALFPGILGAWGLDAVHLVGHDLAGVIGLRLAVHSPALLRSLTLVNIASYDSWPSPTWRRIIDRHFAAYREMPADEFREMMAGQLRMTVYDKSTMSGEVLERYLEPLSGPLGQVSYFEHQMRHYDCRYSEEITPMLGSIQTPVGLIWGAEDEWQPLSWARRLERDIPGANLEVIAEAGHFSMEEAPRVVAGHIAAFVAVHGDAGKRTG